MVTAMITKAQGSALLQIARDAIKEAFEHKTVFVPHHIRNAKAFMQQPGVFVTILKSKQLRGSVGYLPGTYPLVDGVMRAARDAAFNDPRFKKVRKDELPVLRIRVDVLSRFTLTNVKGIKPQKDGIYIEFGLFKALQLPEDTKKFKWTARETIENALRKAGLAPEMWNDKNVKIYKFVTHVFEEKSSK